MAGKGSKPRPYSVTQKQFANNWDKIFNKSHDNCGTPECCGTCDTAVESVKKSTSNKNKTK